MANPGERIMRASCNEDSVVVEMIRQTLEQEFYVQVRSSGRSTRKYRLNLNERRVPDYEIEFSIHAPSQKVFVIYNRIRSDALRGNRELRFQLDADQRCFRISGSTIYQEFSGST